MSRSPAITAFTPSVLVPMCSMSMPASSTFFASQYSSNLESLISWPTTWESNANGPHPTGLVSVLDAAGIMPSRPARVSGMMPATGCDSRKVTVRPSAPASTDEITPRVGAMVDGATRAMS